MSILKDSFIQYIIKFLKSKIEAKQDKLVSGSNIKTINGTSVLGAGNITIEGGSGFDSSGSYPNLTAGKANKLATARTISLSGATVGNASFDGSKDVSIPINNIYQGNIVWGGRNNIGELSPLEATNPFFSADRFAFGSSDAVTVEYSNDGGATWLDYGANNGDKAKLFLSQINQSGAFYVGNKTGSVTTDDMLRITIDGSLLAVYCRLNCILLKVAKISGLTDAICDIEYTFNNGSVGSKKNNYIQGWPAWNGISFAQHIPFGASESNAVTKVIKLTFKVTKNLTNSPCLQNVMGIANTCYDTYPSFLAKYGTVYSVDGSQNAIFPAIIRPRSANTQDIGMSSLYWRNIYGNKFITKGGTNQQVLLGDGSLKALSEISPITDADADILLDNHIHNIDVYANGNDVNISVIESSKNGNTWETEDKDIPIPLATTTSAGVMSKEDKNKLDSLSTSAGRGMTIPGTVNLTNGTFNTQNNSSLNSYTKVFGDMSVGEMRMYLVADSSGNLPSTSETAVTVPHDGILSPAQVYFGKSAAFGVSVGDICVLFKKSSLLNICRIIPLNDVKPSNGDFPGADGLSTVWDKNRINKIDGIEWTANHVRDNYLPKSDRFPSRTDWLINVNYCVDNGVYPTCDAASMQVGLVNNYVTLIVHRTSTVDNGGFDTVEQTAYGRGADEGKIYKRIIFYYGSSTEYGDWKRIDLDNTYTKEEVDTKIGDINTILESIINN